MSKTDGKVFVDKVQLEQFMKKWDRLLKEIPQAKTVALAAMAAQVKRDVDGQIIAQGVDDAMGHVRSWQEIRLGSGGGYVAVSPRKETVRDRFGRAHTHKGKAVTARQVTRWLERGHGARKSSPGSKRRWSRAIDWSRIDMRTGLAFVPGHAFYSWAKIKAAEHAVEAAERALHRVYSNFKG